MEPEQPEERNLENMVYRYPLSLSQMSVIKLSFPECLLKEDLTRTSFPYSLFSERVGETEFLHEAQGFLLTLKNKSNLYYIMPTPNHSVFGEFTETADFGTLFPLFDPEASGWVFVNL